MKISNLQKTLALVTALTLVSVFFACGTSKGALGKAKSPTEAYEQLFAAVKSKDTERIKKVMSKGTIGFAESVAGQYKKPVEEIFKNGFTSTTFADSLPAIRDERVSEKYGAIEVYNKSEKQWNDIPFILEDGGWKLAVGDQFGGSFKSPGKSRTTREKENANAAGKSDMIPYGNGNLNTNIKPTVIDPSLSNRTK